LLVVQGIPEYEVVHKVASCPLYDIFGFILS